MDFDLMPWVNRELLTWIAPGDASLTLRQGLGGCPYVNLPGTRALQRIQYGTIRTAAAAAR